MGHTTRRSVAAMIGTVWLTPIALARPRQDARTTHLSTPAPPPITPPPTPSTSPKPIFRPMPSQLAEEQRGLSLAQLCDRLMPLYGVQKERFESTTEYLDRIVELSVKEGCPIASDIIYPARVPAKRLILAYDADTEIVTVGHRYVPEYKFTDLSTMIIDPSYNGRSAVLDESAQIDFSRDILTYADPNQPPSKQMVGLTYPKASRAPAGQEKFRMARPVARNEFDAMHAIFEGTIEVPGIAKGVTYVRDDESKTMNYRVAYMAVRYLTFCNFTTGEVFHQIGFSDVVKEPHK